MIQRDRYLSRLISRRENGKIKVVTGIRRCGKSVLLLNIFKDYLLSSGVRKEQLIILQLDKARDARYRNPLELENYLKDRLSDSSGMHYVLIDEIQEVVDIPNPWLPEGGETIGFTDVLLDLVDLDNADIYVTGSNSRMLSTDILTEFRDRGDEIHIAPLEYKVFQEAYPGDKHDAWRDFYTYGGLPRILGIEGHAEKSSYLSGLIRKTYLSDVIERNRLRADKDILDSLLSIIASSVGSLTNPAKLSRTFRSVCGKNIHEATLSKYLDCFEEAYIVGKAMRYDVKGKKYMDTPLKYYFSDVGLRNAALNFRQTEENHLMEDIIYNELRIRGFSVDVGMVEYNWTDDEGKKIRSQLEVDFVANNPAGKRYYIQSAFMIPDSEKRAQETGSLHRIDDTFEKIVIVKDNIVPWYDEKGIYTMGVEEFLLNYIDTMM